MTKEETMASVKDRPILNPTTLQKAFDTMFPILAPKKDTRKEDKQEGRQKEKKRRDDD
jgi:hypothetical protein